jgi:Mrp family chromosome partitioning ATPase
VVEPTPVQKLKFQPTPTPVADGALRPSPSSATAAWAALQHVELIPRRVRQNRIVSAIRRQPAHTSFDVLRTKILTSLRQNAWTTVAITSPEPRCGKSVIAANLAFSMANLPEYRTVLIDLDFRRPRIAALLGLKSASPTAAFLDGRSSIEEAFVRYGENLAVSAGRSEISFPAELLQSQTARAAVKQIRERLQPNIILLDLPPVLGSDDVLAFLPNVDCTLLVVAAGSTTIPQIHSCERELASETNLLGVVLNKCRYDQRTYY